MLFLALMPQVPTYELVASAVIQRVLRECASEVPETILVRLEAAYPFGPDDKIGRKIWETQLKRLNLGSAEKADKKPNAAQSQPKSVKSGRRKSPGNR